jgi:hypothetical protein
MQGTTFSIGIFFLNETMFLLRPPRYMESEYAVNGQLRRPKFGRLHGILRDFESKIFLHCKSFIATRGLGVIRVRVLCYLN